MKSGGSGVLRDIYTVFFRYYHLLPDEVGKQNPRLLFALLDGSEAEDDYDYSDNEHLMMFYGR